MFLRESFLLVPILQKEEKLNAALTTAERSAPHFNRQTTNYPTLRTRPAPSPQFNARHSS